MTPVEFNNQMTRLIRNFGKNAYSEERGALIWREVQHLSAVWLENTVDRFIGDCKYAPLLPEFREAIAKEREYQHSQKRETIESSIPHKYDCTFCKDVGVYICEQVGTGAPYAFRCHCIKGEQDSRKNIPQYKKAHEKEFKWMDYPLAKEFR